MNPHPRSCRRGFTLTEVMTATTITLILTAMVLGLLLAMTRQFRDTEIKTSVSDDYREMTRVIVEQGNMANAFYVYPSFAAGDRVNKASQIPHAGSGDLVLFVFYSFQDIKTSPNLQGVCRVLGVFRENSGNVLSPIRWFDSAKHNWGQSFSPANPLTLPLDGTGIESLIPPASFASSCPVLANHARGAAQDSLGVTQDMFYNDANKTLHVTGFITRAGVDAPNAPVAAGVAQNRIPFNLTASPRSL